MAEETAKAAEPLMITPAKSRWSGSSPPCSTSTTTVSSASSPAATRIQCGKRPYRRSEATGWPVSRIRNGAEFIRGRQD